MKGNAKPCQGFSRIIDTRFLIRNYYIVCVKTSKTPIALYKFMKIIIKLIIIIIQAQNLNIFYLLTKIFSPWFQLSLARNSFSSTREISAPTYH